VALERIEGDVLSQRASIHQDTALGAIAGDSGELPSLVCDGLQADEVTAFATQHLYAAIQAGYDPNDECLHWFHPDHIEEFLPNLEQLLNLEYGLLQRAGKRLVSKGRIVAIRSLQRELGLPSAHERRDWGALPAAYVRDFLETTTDDDRSLTVARLELIARKAQNEMDLKTELNAVKLIAQIKGLMFNDLDGRNQKALAALFATAAPRSADLAIVNDSEVTRKLRQIAE
jgi:hypothetical protein